MGSKTQTTTQNSSSEPWAAAQPALKTGLADAQNLKKTGIGSQPYTGSTVIPSSIQTTQGMNSIQNAANANMGGSGVSGQYQGVINNGGFTDGQSSALGHIGNFARGAGNVGSGRIQKLGLMALNNPALANYGQAANGAYGVDASAQRALASTPWKNPGHAAFSSMMDGGYGTSSNEQRGVAHRIQGEIPGTSTYQSAADGGLGVDTSAQRGMVGAGLAPSYSEQNLMGIARGDMLARQDPHFERALKAASESAANQINMAASASGRYGSGVHQGNVAREIGDYEAGQRVSQYNNERQNQMAANQMVDAQRMQGLGFGLNAANSASGLDQFNRNQQMQGANALTSTAFGQSDRALNAYNAATGIEQGNQAMRAQGASNLSNQYANNINQTLSALNSASGLDQFNRNQIMQGIAGQGSTYAGGIGQALGAAGQSAGIESDNYSRQIAALQQQFNAGQQGFNNLGSAYEGMKTPAQDLMGVGSMKEDLAGRLKNDELRIFQEQQNAPWNQLGRVNAIAGGIGSMGKTSQETAQVPGQSPFATGLGYASTGMGLLGSAKNLGWF